MALSNFFYTKIKNISTDTLITNLRREYSSQIYQEAAKIRQIPEHKNLNFKAERQSQSDERFTVSKTPVLEGGFTLVKEIIPNKELELKRNLANGQVTDDAKRIRMKIDKHNFLVELAEQRRSETLTGESLQALLRDYPEAIDGDNSRIDSLVETVKKELISAAQEKVKSEQEKELSAEKFKEAEALRKRQDVKFYASLVNDITKQIEAYEQELTKIEKNDKTLTITKDPNTNLYKAWINGKECIYSSEKTKSESKLEALCQKIALKILKHNFLVELSARLRNGERNSKISETLENFLGGQYKNANAGIIGSDVKGIVDSLRAHLAKANPASAEEEKTRYNL